MDIITGVAASAVGGWLVACVKGHALAATAILGGTTAALYLTAPARKYPTAEAVTKEYTVDLSGKVALVTGATSGIGTETARVLCLSGAHVYLAGRNPKKLAAVKEELAQSLPQACRDKLTTVVCDLGDLKSVQAAAKQVLSEQSRLDVLVNNAYVRCLRRLDSTGRSLFFSHQKFYFFTHSGVMAIPERQPTAQGLESQVGICHVGHFYLTKLLLPALQAAAKLEGSARVVALSSSAHSYHEMHQCLEDPQLETLPYDPWTAYGNAKAANLLFAKGFNNRYASDGASAPVFAFSVMPGGIFTGLQDTIDLRTRINYTTVAPLFFKTIPQGAATSILCATAPVRDVVQPGEYHDNCAPKPAALTKVLEYCQEQQGTGKEDKKGATDIVDKCWTQTERLLKDLGF
jgi:NAD(P)-dependent dehydrogenase (short-subunit alcohol dehydrogenase family)